MLYWISKPLVLAYIDIMLRMDVYKHEQLPEGAKIIAANHPTTTDPFYVAAMLRQQAFILINELLFQVPLLGIYLHKAGHIPVIAGHGEESLQAALECLKEGKTVVIFPEGSLSPAEGGSHPARTGVARLALMSGAPVFPVGIHLAMERAHVMHSKVGERVAFSRWHLTGPYHVTVGKAMHFGGNVENRMQVRSIAAEVMGRIVELARESENRMKMAVGTV